VLHYLQHAIAILGANPTDGGGKMAFWRKKEPEYEETDHIIHENPGITPADLARELGVARSTVTRRLPSLEEAGYLYTEDERGGLWPFKHTE
jgi:DNA-binding transcriptional ArsR family regulator